MSDTSPVLLWHRRDLRLSDHPAWAAAAESGRPVIPVYINDDQTAALGAAAQWRLGAGLRVFGDDLRERNSRLILRRGAALPVLRRLIEETGAGAVWWQRLYDPAAVARDTEVKAVLKADGIDARSFAGHLLFEPWTVETKAGGYYKVFTPMWKAVRDRDVPAPSTAPGSLTGPKAWPDSDTLEDWHLDRAMQRGAAVLAEHAAPAGARAAEDRLGAFLEEGIADYDTGRNMVGTEGTSGLSTALAWGEIGPRQCWHGGLRARAEGSKGAETWMKELVWREFAYHLMHHTPHILTENWRPEWREFPWRTGPSDEADAWMRARTGIRFVDAALREMYVTGTMHNRGRMIVASYLTKHLMTHWRIGQTWFADCLVDWDPASNALGWQWTAGSGPDASPYFRVFNPVTQLDKFDPERRYVDTWIAEGNSDPAPQALAYFDAVPRRWGLDPADAYPAPIVTPEAGRDRALAAYENRNF